MLTNIHPSLWQRKIIHFDMDAFYANVEVRDDPSLRGKAVIVGGSPQSRGVVCTASYEARKFGIRSAMPCSQAARLCQDAIFLKPDFEKYKAVSGEIRLIFQKYTTMIEPLSLDEAYLDVTNNHLGFYAVKIAKLIQDEICESLHLTGSAGIAPNKLIAKIASDYRKPKGITVVIPEQVSKFIGPLPLRKINGVGPVTEESLQKFGLKHCSDVWPFSLEELVSMIGRNRAEWLYDASRGIDDRPVENTRTRKSLGHERTFQKDILDSDQLRLELSHLVKDLSEELQRKNLRGRTITLKVRYDDFTRATRSQSLAEATANPEQINDICSRLLLNTDAGKRKIRLLGAAVSGFVDSL